MKKPKKAAAPAKPPETDAEALIDIVAWSAARPSWQRQALRLLAQSDQLTTDQLDELYQLVLSGGEPPAPLVEGDLRSSQAQAATVTLKSVAKPEDVNALASDQTLSFEKSGLTIVYGDNGAGKSGYARILKDACRARIDGKGLSIIPNIYSTAPGTPRARINFVVNGQNTHADWQLGSASPPALSAVSVFDARTAHVHVDGTNDVAYVPSSLDLLQRLAKTADQLRDRLKQAKQTIESQTPQLLRSPPVGPETEVAKFLSVLKHDTDVVYLRTLSILSPDEQAELDNLRRDLGGDTGKAARQLSEQRDGVARFAATLGSLCQLGSVASLARLRELHAAKAAAEVAAAAVARDRFAGDPLPNIGSEAWRVLWEAARRYATLEGRPDRPFPPVTSDENCPLCQQSLSAVAVDRLARFEAFVRDDTKQQADRATKAFEDYEGELGKATPTMAQTAKRLRYLSDTLSDAHAAEAAHEVAIRAAWQLRRIRRNYGDEGFAVEDVDARPALAELGRLADSLQVRQSALTADAQSPERKAMLGKLASLNARFWLAGVLPDVEAEIARKAELLLIDKALLETDTKSITQKSGALAEALITDTLRAQFAKEIDALGIGTLAVELKKEQAQVGAARFRVRLVRKPTAAVGTVLSEGEHRCVALAAFLAELITSGAKSAIIFDDPVSSLDHRHRSEVAARLAEEAKQRQVIVLTHDVAFLMLLNQAAADTQVHVGYRCIARGSDLAGFCSHDLPYNARPVDDVLAALEADLKNKSVLWEKGRQGDWRNAVRAALEQLRETWERAVEEFIGPVFKRLSTKVDSKNLRLLTVLEVQDCDAMRAGFQTCSEMLHSAGESLNPKLPSPAELQAEIDKLRNWFSDLRARQGKVKAA